MIFTDAQRSDLQVLTEKRFKDARRHQQKAPSGAVLKKKFKVAQQALGDLESALRGAGKVSEAGDIEHVAGMIQGVAKRL